MKHINLFIGALFLALGIAAHQWHHEQQEPKPHNHSVIANNCIANGVKCSDLIYCHTTGKQVDGLGRHKQMTREDSVRYDL